MEESRQFSIRVPVDLIEAMDEEAERLHVSRATFIKTACIEYIEARRFMRAQPDIQAKMYELQTMLSEVAQQGQGDTNYIIGQQSLFEGSDKSKKGKRRG